MKPSARALQQLFATETLGSPDNAVGFVLWRVVHRYQREIDRVLAPLDLTHLQFTTLAMVAWLSHTGEPTTQSSLARAAEMHPMQVSLMLKALEAKGYVDRNRSPLDVRAKVLALTTTGLATLRKAMPPVIDVQARMFGADGAVGGPLLDMLHDVERRAREADAG